MNRELRGCVVSLVMVLLCLVPAVSGAQEQASIEGAVLDPLGGRLAGATVTLIGDRGQTAETKNGNDGRYQFTNVAPARYQVLARAQGFEAFTSEPVFVGPGQRVTIDLTLQLGALQQGVVVTAAAAEVSIAQTGAPVTVLDAAVIEGLNKPDLLEALRLVPGSQISQVGARGGTTSFFIRGGNSNFNKVLIDGIPVNEIGGAFDFAQLGVSGVERVEVLRQANSVRYGSDALAGVVDITTRRGRTRIPQAELSLDGGNLGTVSTGALIGGAVRRFDYFSTVSHFQTDNQQPNNEYRNGTYAGRFGVALGRGTDLSGSVRYIDTRYESPNGITLYGIPDDSFQNKEQAWVSLAARSQWSDRWQSNVRFGWTDEEYRFHNPSPSGTPFDPFGFGENYLGEVVTLTGANGYSVTGRAILDFGGSFDPYYQRMGRQLIAGDTTTQLTSWFAITGGGRFEHERGYDDPEADDPVATRNNGGVFVEGRASVRNRAYISAGVGYERNAVFEDAVTPRLSIAAYLREPTATAFGETKVVLNAGKGIKSPSVFQEQNSLLDLVAGTPAAGNFLPVGAERSRNFDIGVEQGFWRGNGRARVSFFHNHFRDLLEFLGRNQLLQAGVPADVVAGVGFGAYFNAASFRAKGVETSSEIAVGTRVRAMGSYTFMDAEVTEAPSASASFNPAFPDIPIGAFSPLVGERPFGRPTHAGTLMVMYTQGQAQVSLAGHFVGKRDYSTFLSDEFFGNSMLLPNQDLAEGYQKIDLSGAYTAHQRLRIYASLENLFDRTYEPAFGFPALPLTARVGVRVLLGGD
jgi:iron complex outermembrane receptor protein/vitamin B12 transporter